MAQVKITFSASPEVKAALRNEPVHPMRHWFSGHAKNACRQYLAAGKTASASYEICVVDAGTVTAVVQRVANELNVKFVLSE